MSSFLSAAFLALFALIAVAGSRREDSDMVTGPRAALPADHDIALYQSVLDGQLRRMDGIDAIISATGLLVFTSMTYLLSVDEVKHVLIARLIAIALIIPLAVTVFAILRYGQLDAPDLTDLDADLASGDREAAFERARDAMVKSFEANRKAIQAKKMLRALATVVATALFFADLFGFVVR